uniref:BTB domain-containing protein n=1 Tax=Panagrellus redivivus TaxID=6233 RepID=A0A7E4URE5_PANRE
MATLLKDSVSVTTVKADNVKSDLREVPGAPWLKWSFNVYPRYKYGSEVGGCVRLVGGDATVNATISVLNQNVTKYFVHFFNDGEEHGCGVISNDKMHWKRSKISYTITCTATFKPVEVDIEPSPHFQKPEEAKADAKIVIGENEIEVNRDYLASISPVFKDIFQSDTNESKTGIVNIADFTFATVKDALDHCSGVVVKHKSVLDLLDLLRFYQEYKIEPVIPDLEALLKANFRLKHFIPVAAYAWKYPCDALQADCGRMFNDNIRAIAWKPEFLALDPNVIYGVVKASVAWKKASVEKEKEESIARSSSTSPISSPADTEMEDDDGVVVLD